MVVMVSSPSLRVEMLSSPRSVVDRARLRYWAHSPGDVERIRWGRARPPGKGGDGHRGNGPENTRTRMGRAAREPERRGRTTQPAAGTREFRDGGRTEGPVDGFPLLHRQGLPAPPRVDRRGDRAPPRAPRAARSAPASSAFRSVFRRWPNPPFTNSRKRLASATRGSRPCRSMRTTALSTRGGGWKAPRGTMRSISTAPRCCRSTESRPQSLVPGAAASRSATSRCTSSTARETAPAWSRSEKRMGLVRW